MEGVGKDAYCRQASIRGALIGASESPTRERGSGYERDGLLVDAGRQTLCVRIASDRVTPADSGCFMPSAAASEGGKPPMILGDEFSDSTAAKSSLRLHAWARPATVWIASTGVGDAGGGHGFLRSPLCVDGLIGAVRDSLGDCYSLNFSLLLLQFVGLHATAPADRLAFGGGAALRRARESLAEAATWAAGERVG